MPAWGSKRGVDVGCDIPDSGLQGGRGVLQAHFHLADGVNDGGVISSKFPSDFREGEIGQLADQIHGNLPCLCRAFIFEGAAQDGFVNGIEPANLADDEGRGGNGVSLHLEHIVDGPGNIGQIQRHVVQIPVSQDFFYGAFNLPDVIGDVVGDVIADVVSQIQTQRDGLVFEVSKSGG